MTPSIVGPVTSAAAHPSTRPPHPGAPRVIVVGAGLIGSVIAWRLAQRGCRVTMITGPQSDHAASHVSAGMLAPITESTFTETGLLGLNLESLHRFGDFAAELAAASDADPGLRQDPTLTVAGTADDAARLRDFNGFLTEQGLGGQLMTSRQLRGVEPLLAPTVRTGLLVTDDLSCDNRMLWRALRIAADRAGVQTVHGSVASLTTTGGRVTGVHLAPEGAQPPTDRTTELDADVVVLAGGAWSGTIDGPVTVPVRPVKGQILRMRAGTLPALRQTVRAFSNGFEVYLVPRQHGELVVGATVEELGFDDRITGEGAYGLLRDARSVVPVTAEYEVAEFNVGWRPGTPDNLPILGPSGVDGLVLATGHYRNGVLLTPITGDVIAEVICGGSLPDVAAPYKLARFGGAAPHPPRSPHEQRDAHEERK